MSFAFLYKNISKKYNMGVYLGVKSFYDKYSNLAVYLLQMFTDKYFFKIG